MKPDAKKRGPKPRVTLEVDKERLRLADGKSIHIFQSHIRKFKSSSGAYIPMTQDYQDHEVFVIVMGKNK
jgi:hypothetical protein